MHGASDALGGPTSTVFVCQGKSSELSRDRKDREQLATHMLGGSGGLYHDRPETSSTVIPSSP